MKTVFHVVRRTKTGKTVNVGDFDTLDAAQEAMLKHYKDTPKRGKFWYAISEERLKEIGGVLFRETSFWDGTYHKTFQADDLKTLSEAG